MTLSIDNSYRYVAPEILKKEAYGMEVDMWSVGIIVFILLGGYMPFDDGGEGGVKVHVCRCVW